MCLKVTLLFNIHIISYIQNISAFESVAWFLIMVGFAYAFYSILLAATSVANAT